MTAPKPPQNHLQLLGNISPHCKPAIARAQAEMAHPSQDWTRQCQKFVRTCLNTGPDADGDGGSAIEAWNAVDPAHRHSWWFPPAGVPYFWAGGDGHTALCDGHGHVWSSDILRPGKVDLVPIDLIKTKWGKAPLGWTELDNDVIIYTPGLVL